MSERVAAPIPGLLPLADARGPLRVLIASLSPGGAERIVIEWLAAEVARGREAELAVLHARACPLAAPARVRVTVRGTESPMAFLRALARRWAGTAVPVSCHLVPDSLLCVLWSEGVATVPVVHNAREGWRNEPRLWRPEHVPVAVACAGRVAEQLREDGCGVPVATVRHRPAVGAAAVDARVRQAMRLRWSVPPGTFLVLAIGAMKRQKDYPRAVEVLARLAQRRDAILAIAGGALDEDGLRVLAAVVDRAVALGVSDRLRLPGFAVPIEPWLAAADAVLNVSRFEGLSMATLEAACAGLPVVATAVGGQGEAEHPRVALVDAGADAGAIAARLAGLPVRATLVPRPLARAPREHSLALAARPRRGPALDALFVTANLNAGGAQRSLVNLAGAMATRAAIAVAVCGESTQRDFAEALAGAGVPAFRPAPGTDPFELAESILATAHERGARSLCFWNADAKVKLLVAKHAPASLRLLDASPGAYAFEELDGVAAFGESIGFAAARFHARLDVLVLKHATRSHPACRRVAVVPNGVALREVGWRRPAAPRFLVHGRIAPSKRLDAVLDALGEVAAGHPQATLEVVGAAEPRHREHLASLEALAARLPVAWRGADASLAYLDEAWTAAVVLGTHQGSPNAVLEAMAASVPVIANASGGTADILDGGRAGWLLPEAAGAREVGVAMREAIADEHRARTFAERARDRVREVHGLEAMARGYLALLAPEASRAHEKMAPWNTASAPPAPARSPSARSETMPARSSA